MNEIIGAVIGGLVVLVGAFLFRSKLFPRNDIPLPPPLPKPPIPKLNEEKKKEIRDELKEMSMRAIAKRFINQLSSGVKRGKGRK